MYLITKSRYKFLEGKIASIREEGGILRVIISSFNRFFDKGDVTYEPLGYDVGDFVTYDGSPYQVKKITDGFVGLGNSPLWVHPRSVTKLQPSPLQESVRKFNQSIQSLSINMDLVTLNSLMNRIAKFLKGKKGKYYTFQHKGSPVLSVHNLWDGRFTILNNHSCMGSKHLIEELYEV